MSLLQKVSFWHDLRDHVLSFGCLVNDIVVGPGERSQPVIITATQGFAFDASSTDSTQIKASPRNRGLFVFHRLTLCLARNKPAEGSRFTIVRLHDRFSLTIQAYVICHRYQWTCVLLTSHVMHLLSHHMMFIIEFRAAKAATRSRPTQ